MALAAQLRPAFDASDRAQFRAAWKEDVAAITVVHNIDSGNVDPAKVVITDASGASPTVYVDYLTAAGGWRQMIFAVENAGGKSPLIELNYSSRYAGAVTADWAMVWTQDFITWTKATTRTYLPGSPNKYRFEFASPLPSGRVYISTSPYYPESWAGDRAARLLANYPTIVTPTSSANSSGVYNVSPAETGALGQPIGGRNQYALKLTWPVSTNDGARKRVMTMFAGIHAQGESQSDIAAEAAINWMLDDASAEAIAFRANWTVYFYSNLTPNGHFGGHERKNFRKTADPNRVWDTSELVEMAATRNAVLADTGLGSGGIVDYSVAWHGSTASGPAGQGFISEFQYDLNNRSQLTTDILDSAATIFGQAIVLGTPVTATGAHTTWIEGVGARASFEAELQSSGETNPQYFKDVGQNWMKSIQLADAGNAFVAPSMGDATATGGFVAVDLVAPIGEGAATASAAASGQFSPVAMAAASGAATAGGNVIASGAFAAIALTPADGTANAGGAAVGVGGFDVLALSAPGASGSAGTGAIAAGSFYAIDLTPASGVASSGGDAIASGGFAGVAVTAPTGDATAGSDAAASGAFAAVVVTAPSGSASDGTNAAASGAFDAVTFSALSGTAQSTANVSASGAFAAVVIDAATGAASTDSGLVADPAFVFKLNRRGYTVKIIGNTAEFPDAISGGESVVLSFDVSEELQEDIALSGTPEVSVSLEYGTDATPANIVSGSAAIVGSTVLVPVTATATPADYRIRVAVSTTTASKKVVAHGRLFVRG